MKICPNCAEKLESLNEKCPKCGIIPKQSTSPVWVATWVAVALVVIVVMGLIFSGP